MFIGYVNNFKSNYGNLQSNILVNLFELYYGNLTLMSLIKYANIGIL